MTNTSLLALVVASFLVCTVTAQSPTPEPCKKVCRSLAGKCNVSLLSLSRTPCFDKRINAVRTCDCNINVLQDLENLKDTDIVRDCVIPRRLFGNGNAVEIQAKLNNVHVTGISNRGTLRQSGDITRSTICEWKCTGGNRFQNCILSGSVKRSTFREMDAGDQATLVITGGKFIKNSVEFMTSDDDIQIGCKGGFDRNKINVLATPSTGRFISVLATKIKKNEFGQIAIGGVASFADIDGNTAVTATVQGPCSVLRVQSPIAVGEFLGLPAGDRECAELFAKS